MNAAGTKIRKLVSSDTRPILRNRALCEPSNISYRSKMFSWMMNEKYDTSNEKTEPEKSRYFSPPFDPKPPLRTKVTVTATRLIKTAKAVSVVISAIDSSEDLYTKGVSSRVTTTAQKQ